MSLKITELRISNFQKISAVSIDPKDHNVLKGDNGAGKSSTLDALQWALTRKGSEQPVRRAAKKAVVQMSLKNEDREFELRRTETSKGTHDLKIISKDGKPVPAPQSFLDGLISSNLAFDPLAFLNLKSKARVEKLREALGIDTSAIEAKRQEAYDERKLVNRDGKNLSERFKALPEPAKDLPAEEENTAELVKEKETLTEKIEAVKTCESELATSQITVKETKDEIAELKKRLKVEQEAEAEAKKALEEARKDEPAAEDVSKLSERIENADTTNAAIRNAAEYKRLGADLEAKRKESQALSDKIEKCEAQKREMIEKADFPVEGMEILEDDVYVDGVPFSQLSTAEQVLVSGSVAMAEDPELPFVLIREGALISVANLQKFYDLADSKDYMVFIEKFCEEPGEDGLFFEDGAITHEDGEEVEPQEEPEEEEPEPEEKKPAAKKEDPAPSKSKGDAMDQALDLE